MNATPKMHLLAQKHVTSKSVHGAGSARSRNRNVRQNHTRSCSGTRIDLSVVTPATFEFHRNPFRGFGATGGQMVDVPIVYTTVQAVVMVVRGSTEY